jgi:hypothetical protein
MDSFGEEGREMIHDRRPCPLDNSRLVEMGASYGERELDLSIWYCPRCDVAFVLLSSARSGEAPSVLQWHRREGQLELREQDRKRWEELPRQFRECWESNVRYHVASFLQRRHVKGVRCPMDGGTRAQVLRRCQDGAGVKWLLAWCESCSPLCSGGFLFAFDPDYGWEYCADVIWNGRLMRYALGKDYVTGGGQRASPELVAQLPPPPVLLPRARKGDEGDGG